MEHSPVQKLSANLRCAFKQSETVRIDELQRQNFSKLCSTARILPIDADLEFTLSVTRYTQTAMPALGKLDLTEDRARRLLVLDDWKQATAAERTSDAQQMDGFQYAGFAAAVGAVKDIDTRRGGEGHRVQIAHPGDRDAAERHLGCAVHGYRRIGMTTYAESSLSDSCTSALLLESDRIRRTCSVVITPRTSSR